MYSANVFAKSSWAVARRRLILMGTVMCALPASTQPLSAQVDQVRFNMHFPTMPSTATNAVIKEIGMISAQAPGVIAVGYASHTNRGYSGLVYDPSGLIAPSSTYLSSTSPTGALWDVYDLIGPPEQWDQNWDDPTLHETYDQLLFFDINSSGLVTGYLYNANALPRRIPFYLELFPPSGTLELKRIPLPAGAAGGRAMYVNQAGEILVHLQDANDADLGPYIFKPAKNGYSEERTVIPYLAGYRKIRGFNSLGQLLTEDPPVGDDVVARHTLDAGTTQQFPSYLLRTIDTGVTETFPELIKAPDNTNALNEAGQFACTFYVRRGPGKGRWAARYGGLPTATKEREWQPPIAGNDRVDALNDAGDATDNLPEQGRGDTYYYDSYYYHEGLPGQGDETFVPSVKDLILPETDPNNAFFDTGRISKDLVSNRNESGFGWVWGTYPNGIGTRGLALLEPVIPGQTPGISVSPTTGLVTTESQGEDSFEIVLNSQPTANVTIGISSSMIDEGTVSPASVTFTPGDWNTPQMVTVTGVDDALDDGNVEYTIVTAPAASTDSDYDGLNAEDVFVTNLDNEMPSGGPIEYERVEDPPLLIPDNSNQGAMSLITGVGDFVPASLIVSLDINHPRPSDLRAWVTGPDGNQLELINVSGDNDLTGLITDTDGNWMLQVIDTKKRKEGALNGWSITIDY